MGKKIIALALLAVYILVVFAMAGFTAAPNQPNDKSQILITYPKSTGTLDIFEIKIEINDPLIKQDLQSITFNKGDIDDIIYILTDKDQSTARRSRLLYRYDGEDTISFLIKTDKFYSEITALPFELDFRGSDNRQLTMFKGSIDIIPITYKIELPSREGYDNVSIDYQYSIASVRGQLQPGQSSIVRFMNLHMMNGARDAGNMDFKLAMIFLLHRPVSINDKLTLDSQKEYINNNLRDISNIGVARSFGTVHHEDISSTIKQVTTVEPLDESELSRLNSSYGIYALHNQAQVVRHRVRGRLEPYKVDGEQVYECYAHKTFTFFIGLELFTLYTNLSQYATASQIENTYKELEAKCDAVMASFYSNTAEAREYVTVPLELEGDEPVFTGHITDFAGRHMKNMEVRIIVGEKSYEGTTDENGYYRIKGEGLDTLPKSYNIRNYLKYKKDDMNFFEVLFNHGNSSYFLIGQKTVKVETSEDLYQHYVYSKDNPDEGFITSIQKSFIDEVATVYHYMSQVVEYYDNSLGLYKEFNIPSVSVFCYGSANGTLYNPSRGIFIHTRDMSTGSPNAPLNREWHEYNHHVQFHMYGGKWPGTPGEFEINHGGYINDSTADSYVEGFAEFMALVTADYYELGNGPIYAELANFDIYYKPWHFKGKAEELAVGSILWKLYSGIYGKEIGIKMEDIWNILKGFSNDFGEVYEKLIDKFPDHKGTIDSMFINHGFFRIKEPGNGEYDQMEPFHDQNRNRRYNPGERFIDLPVNIEKERIEARYQPGSTVGYAADAGRPDRRSPLVPEGHFIKTNGNASYYKVTVTFDEHPSWNYSLNTYSRDGLITVVVPPDEYPSTVLVEPLNVAHERPLTITSREFYKNLDENIAAGYFLEHDFKETETIERVERPENLLSSRLPYPLTYIDENDKEFVLTAPEPETTVDDQTVDTIIETDVGSSPSEESGVNWGRVIALIILANGVIGAIGAFIYFKLIKKS